MSDKFNLILMATIGCLVLICVLLIILLSSSNLGFRSIEISGGIESADLSDNQMILSFSRPLDAESFQEEWVSFSPQVDFNFVVQGARLNIFPVERLQADTEYTLRISESVADIYQTTLSNPLEFNFQTKPNEFVYLENLDDKDTLWLGNISNSKAREIVSQEKIDWYDLNNRILVFSTFSESDLTSTIKVVSLTDEDFDEIELILDSQEVKMIEVSPDFDEFLYISQNVSTVDTGTDRIIIPDGVNSLRKYTLDDNSTEDITFTGVEEGVSDAMYSRDGGIIFVRNTSSDYFRVSNADFSNFEFLGKINRIGNTDYTDSRISIMTFPLGVSISLLPNSRVGIMNLDDRSATTISDEDRIAKEPYFLNTSESIVYSEEHGRVENRISVFETLLLDSVGENKYIQQKIFSSSEDSYEQPSVSFDDRYISLERYSLDDLSDFDNIRFFLTHSQPGNGDIVFYDLKANEYDVESPILVVEDAVDLVWIE